MGAVKIILITVLIIAIGFGSYLVYSVLQTPKVLSVNIVDLAYEEIGSSVTERCDTCFQNPTNPAACVGPSIKSSFNLQVKNFKNPIYCKVTSNGLDLTNPFLSYNGINNIQDAYGEQLKQRYNIKISCTIKQDLSNSICSEERNLNARCLVA